MDDPIAAWEGEGGRAEHRMIGTLNQIAWAMQIKSQVDAEFDRVRRVLRYAMRKQSPEDTRDIEAIIRILEDKRAEVMENKEAGYFIHEWRELRDQVAQMVVRDPRYKAIKDAQTARQTKLASQNARES
jgi:hypothetical protein